MLIVIGSVRIAIAPSVLHHVLKVLAMGMAWEAIPQHYPLKVGMALKGNTHKVENLAFLKIGPRPDLVHRWNSRLLPSVDLGLNHCAVVMCERSNVIDHLKMINVVHGRDRVKKIEGQGRVFL
jgi:hypothetical protein